MNVIVCHHVIQTFIICHHIWYDYRWLYQSANDAIFTNYMFQLWHLFLASSWYLTMRNKLSCCSAKVWSLRINIWGKNCHHKQPFSSALCPEPCAQNKSNHFHVPRTNLTISFCSGPFKPRTLCPKPIKPFPCAQNTFHMYLFIGCADISRWQ